MKISEMIKAYGGMIIGKTDYWHPDMIANNVIKNNEIGCYYIDTRSKHNYIGVFDKEGIPLLDCDGELIYFPVTIAFYALGNFDKYIDTGEEIYSSICIKCADWFVENISEVKENVFGYVNVAEKGIYKMGRNWISALSQSQAMSVLSRAYTITNETRYLDTCSKMLQTFKIESYNGGVLTYLNGGTFYEEYPSKIPSYVLNGFIFSLWGLLDYYIVSSNIDAKVLYEDGLKTLVANLSIYNIKFLNWSRYDLYPFKIKDIGSIFYHKLHIQQLKAMYNLTNINIFNEYSQKWDKSSKNIFVYILATIYKILHKLSIRKECNYVPSIKEK